LKIFLRGLSNNVITGVSILEDRMSAVVTSDSVQRYEDIFKRHAPLIYRTAYGITGSHEDAEDRYQIFTSRTTLVHNGVMASKEKSVRQSVTLPAKVATQVRSMAKRRRLSANRMLVELVEEGIVAKKEKEKAFFELAERFRSAEDPKEVERLGEELGQMVFGR
jgi:hypothetical protein